MDESGVLAGVAGYNIEGTINWRDGNRTVTLVPMVVTANFFDLLGVPIAQGRGFTAVEAAAERNPRVVVVSHPFWRQRLGGDPGAVGRRHHRERRCCTVVGVLPRESARGTRTGLAPEIYLPLSASLMPDINGQHRRPPS